jgi:hypothetical protein
MVPFYHRDNPESEWLCKRGTLNDRTACKEFGLTEDELAQAGKIRAHRTWIYGSPCIRLLRGAESQ